MTITDEEKEERWAPKIIQGGLAGAEPPDKSHDWLSELEIGTVFLVQDKTDLWSYVAHQFEIVDKSDYHVRLFTMGSSNVEILIWVIPKKFCNKFILAEITGIRKGNE